MNIFTLIPARKGSKGVKGKNKKVLATKPLVCHTFEIAEMLPENFCVYLSSDDKEILDLSRKYSIKNNGPRPSSLSSDEVLTIEVIKYELDMAEKNDNMVFDAVLLLQPTCPIRDINDIIKAQELLESNPEASIVSVEKVDSAHPFRMKRIENGFLINFIDQGFEDMRPRQELPIVYLRNGSIYLTPRKFIVKDNSMVGDTTIPIVMDEKHSVNIDSNIDFLIAEHFLNNKDSAK